jgi:rhodanese-related sulfurtransferase
MSKKTKNRLSRKEKMPWLWIGLGAGIVVAVIIVALLLFNNTWATNSRPPLAITAAQAAARRDAGAFILDVRQPEEWNEFHVPGSTLIPLGELPARVQEVPRDKDIVVVCRSGNRSQSGRDILRQAGFTQVTSLAGGLKQWQAAGLPTVTGP